MFDDRLKSNSMRRHKDRDLDKLLIVVAPRESMALGCLVVFMLAFAAWVAFGSVDRVVSLDGVVHRTDTEGSWQATLEVAPALAQAVRPGMAAQVEVVGPDGTLLTLQGEVAPPDATPPPEGVAAQLPRSGDGARRIDVALAPGAALSALEGSPCRISISLGRQSIVGLLTRL